MSLESQILGDEGAAEAIAEDWDRLAVALAKPYSTPAWALAWWRHAAPAGGALRIVAVHDGGELIGVAPLWAPRGGARSSPYEVLGGRIATPAGPIAAAGREEEVAAELARALAEAQPRPTRLEFEDALEDGWAARLAAAWPGRPATRLDGGERPHAVIEVGGLEYDEWLKGKSSKFRGRVRRGRRHLDEEGARFELAGEDGLEAALEEFARLNGARWEDRGGSNAVFAGLKPMFLEIGERWRGSGRLRVFTLGIGDEVAAVWVMLVAGSGLAAWNTGFDERWSKLSPAFQLMLHVIADCGERGEQTISLGGGAVEYKLRLANRVGEVSRATLVPPGTASILTRLRLVPAQARQAAGERLSDEAKARLRRFRPRR